MERLLLGTKTFTYYPYNREDEFEKVIVANASAIFGSRSIYIDIKKRIGTDIVTIPDGYLIDFSIATDPKLYIIENELSSHDPYKHIGSQLLKFAISYKASSRKIKQFLLEHFMQNPEQLKQVEEALQKASYRNIDAFLESIIHDKPVAAVVIIDKSTSELENVLSQLTMSTDIIEFQTFINGSETIHKFRPFNDEIREITEATPIPNKESEDVKVEELDTIIVPAHEEGFNEVFIGENSWYAIRLSAAMVPRIKYIAAYITAPTSAITHYAEVATIDKYKDTNKYILYFKGPAKPIGPIKLDEKRKGAAPQNPRYTTFDKLTRAKTVTQVIY